MKKKLRLKKKFKIIFSLFILIIIAVPIIYFLSNKNEEIDIIDIVPTSSKKTEEKKDTNIKITMVGDLLFESPFYKAIDNGYDKTIYFSEVKDYFSNDDLSIGNMEVVIGNDNLKTSGDGYNFCAPESIGDLVSTLDFEVLSTANNHSYDRNIDGLKSTLDYFKNKTDIMTVGTYYNETDRNTDKILDIKGIKFGFLSYTLGTNIIVPSEYRNQIGLYRNPDTKTVTDEYKNKIKDEVTSLRDKVDVLIVMMHWGQEFTYTPNSEQKSMAEFLNGLGVDIIYGSHSHCIQPIDVIGDEHKTLVYYSFGNFVSADDDIARTPLGQETFDNAYNVGLLSTLDLTFDENKQFNFNNVKTELIVNYFDSNMNNFKLIPFSKYSSEYETNHLRYSKGLTNSFIKDMYNNVINEKYRN